VAISVAWQTIATGVTTSAVGIYTIPTASTASFGSYARDLVVCNSGTATVFVGLGVSNVATSVASFQIPPGGTILLTQCQVPNSGTQVLSGLTGGAGTTSVSVGFATNVNYF
jgi:hypothetical protein